MAKKQEEATPDESAEQDLPVTEEPRDVPKHVGPPTEDMQLARAAAMTDKDGIKRTVRKGIIRAGKGETKVVFFIVAGGTP